MQFALALLVAGTAGARDAPPATPTFLKMDMIRLTPVSYAMRTEHYRHHTTPSHLILTLSPTSE